MGGVVIKITKLECTNVRYGTWRYSVSSKGNTLIGGDPFPAEAEAHHFQTQVIPKIEKVISEILSEEFKIDH